MRLEKEEGRKRKDQGKEKKVRKEESFTRMDLISLGINWAVPPSSYTPAQQW